MKVWDPLTRLFAIFNFVPSLRQRFDYPTANLPLDFKAGPNIRQMKSGFNEIVFSSGVNMPSPFVTTDVGNFEGYFMKVISGRDIYAFEGIYYAEPPVRFQAPVPKNTFEGNFSAKSVGSDCVQTYMGPLSPVTKDGVYFGSEDCLSCNIYTPEILYEGRYPDLPVIFNIYGGSFVFGSARDYGPAYLLEQDVILVGCNYRLGALGFLSTGDEVASGNWGLKDLSLALDWTHKHIRNFGGDPNRIVVMGESAGAVLGHLLLMSPTSKDKISGTILISGNALTSWAVMDPGLALRMTRSLAVMNFCPTNQGNLKMIDCLRRKSGFLLETTKNLIHVAEQLTVQFSPVIEPDIAGAVITKAPEDYYAQGLVPKIPAMFSENSMDADLFKIALRFTRSWSLMQLPFNVFLPQLLNYHHNKVKNQNEITKKIQGFYGGNGGITSKDNFIKAFQYRYFTEGWRKSMGLHSHIAPTFGYLLDHHSKRGFAGRAALNPKEFGVPHAEDLMYVFNRTDIKPIRRRHPDFAVVKFFQNIFTNFAVDGEPSYTTEDRMDQKLTEAISPPPSKTFQIFVIGNEEVKSINIPWETNVTRFWDSLNIKKFPSLTG